MPSPLYRFHCTDGMHAVIDPRGRAVATKTVLAQVAEQVAGALIAVHDPLIDWSDWIVDVHDGQGRTVLQVPFPTAVNPPVRRRAPQGGATWA